jgi:demethylmenaquinone methyltransferase/2-methoxy-6-polyprenyl-1,4-benzoquinol methylase
MTEPSRQEVWKMFDRISSTYDKINRVVSFGRDRSWRRQVAKYLPKKKKIRLLDIATGTGDQILSLFEQTDQIEKAVGIDLSSDMLKIATQKIREKPFQAKITLQLADAQKLPFPSESFDAVTLSFGIRNVPSPKLALQEIYRILKPKGRCLILEFSLPPKPIRSFYLFYLRYILPSIGRILSRDPAAYRYLNQTIETFPYGKQFAFLMKEARFEQIEIHPMALGAVSLYVGVKS